MAYDWQNRAAARPATWAEVDTGLRQFMLRVYNYMGAALVLTGLVAYGAAASGLYLSLYRSGLIWLAVFAPLGLVFLLSFGIQRMSLMTAQLSFWAYSALVGLSLGYIFLVYTGASVVSTFFITAAMFLAMSLYGYTTGRDLTGMGSFLFMGLIGIVIASIVNLFIFSSALGFAISVIGVLIFTGLTAYDTQRIKESYFAGDDGTIAGKKAIMGALQLYLDFLNLFIMLLRLLGQSRN